jgi:hypothetical protein
MTCGAEPCPPNPIRTPLMQQYYREWATGLVAQGYALAIV